jgi:hypothetical protein
MDDSQYFHAFHLPGYLKHCFSLNNETRPVKWWVGRGLYYCIQRFAESIFRYQTRRGAPLRPSIWDNLRQSIRLEQWQFPTTKEAFEVNCLSYGFFLHERSLHDQQVNSSRWFSTGHCLSTGENPGLTLSL